MVGVRIVGWLALALASCTPAVAARPEPLASPAPAASALARLPNGEPILRLPFTAGAVVLCQQGNRTGKKHSHGYANALHALDLSTLQPGTPVVAAADGTVQRVVTGAKAGVDLPGGGFGNQAVLDHGEGFTSLYAHLAEVVVRDGQTLRAGERLGTMGDTGQAGNPHVHFSLHRAAWPDPGAPATVAMHALVAADADAGDDLAVRMFASTELICADANLSPEGHRYGSENDGTTPVRFGPPEAALAARWKAAAETLGAVIESHAGAEAIIAHLQQSGPEETLKKLDAFLVKHGDDPVALYWVAVIGLRDLHDAERARPAVARLVELVPKEPPWIGRWVTVRRAQLAELDGNKDEARRLWQAADAEKVDDPEFRRMVDAALRATAR